MPFFCEQVLDPQNLQGPDGMRKLREGPNIASYRGLKIVNSRAFSMEVGAPPRDVLRRRVRVAEYYRIPWEECIEQKSFALYDESKDAWQKFTWHELYRMSLIGKIRDDVDDGDIDDFDDDDQYHESRTTKLPSYQCPDPVDFSIKRRLLDLMTVGDYIREADQTCRLDVTGNMVLNPWYALFRVDVLDGRQVPVYNNALDGLRRQPYRDPGGPNAYPAPGTDLVDRAAQSEFMFRRFPEYLKAFGYQGNMDFANKSEAAIAALQAQFAALAPAIALTREQLTGAAPIDPAQEGPLTAFLNARAENDCLRGHPDYSHISYRTARRNFDMYLRMYLFGRADYIPPKAREFFDQFNWQRFGVDAPADRLDVAVQLLFRVYDFRRPPALGQGGYGQVQPIPAVGPFPPGLIVDVKKEQVELVIVRPNIEHNMLGIIMGKGGIDELGATFWGQTELSCYDDSMHGEFSVSNFAFLVPAD